MVKIPTFMMLLAALVLLCTRPAQAQTLETDRLSAVIFVYHRIGDDNAPSENIRTESFAAQMQALKNGGYTVLPLSQIIVALKAREPLPPHTVALTFDGGYRSVLNNAVPILLKNDFPFTVFIAPGQMDQKLPDYMGWDDARRLSRNKLVTIGMHSSDYTRLSDTSGNEITRQINSAKARFREALNMEPALFAYPFGEYSLAYRNIIEKNGFAAAFGQQSGVASPGSDLFALPRFSMTDSYSDMDRFRMTAEALPLPVTDIEPKDPHLTTARPSIGFTVDPELKGQLSALSCFVSDQSAPGIHVIGDTRVEIRLAQPLTTDKARINCTLPVHQINPDDPPRWRWWGMLVTAPGGDDTDDSSIP